MTGRPFKAALLLVLVALLLWLLGIFGETGLDTDAWFVGVAALCLAMGLVGLAWPSLRTIWAVALALALPIIVSDFLMLLGVGLPWYCGEPVCDPGPLPLSLVLPFLLPLLLCVWVGTGIGRRAAVR